MKVHENTLIQIIIRSLDTDIRKRTLSE